MTKSKLKKSYCIMSFVFAVAVLIIALTLSMGQTRVYAADTSSDMITGLSNTDSSDGLTDATSDINNGLSITYNNDTGAVSTPIKALLVLTSFTGTVHSDYDDFLYQNHHRAAFPAHRDRYTDSTAESDSRRSCPVFDILYYVADLSAD